MRVLSIGTDRNLFKENSEVRQRIIEYGRLVKELHIIVFSKQSSPAFAKASAGKQIPNTNVFLYPTNSLTRFHYISDAIKIGKKINKPDLITTQDPFECGRAGYELAQFFGCKLQLQIHTDPFSKYFKRESFLNRIRVHMARSLIPRANCIRVVSKRIRDSLDLRFKNQDLKISVLPIFVDVEKIKATPVKTDLRVKYPNFSYILLVASRLAKEKNIGMVIEAVAEIVRNYPGYPGLGLVIVGDGPEKKKLAKKVKRFGIQKNVKFEDWTDDLISYFKRSDLFILSSNYEGYGRTVIEAMAAECPVLMTDVGLAGDIVKNGLNAIVVPVGDNNKFKEALKLVVVSPRRAQELSFGANQVISDLPTKEEYLEQYKKHWESC